MSELNLVSIKELICCGPNMLWAHLRVNIFTKVNPQHIGVATDRLLDLRKASVSFALSVTPEHQKVHQRCFHSH